MVSLSSLYSAHQVVVQVSVLAPLSNLRAPAGADLHALWSSHTWLVLGNSASQFTEYHQVRRHCPQVYDFNLLSTLFNFTAAQTRAQIYIRNYPRDCDKQ
jgi:hypothetical protein